jgi:uncharacterized protein
MNPVKWTLLFAATCALLHVALTLLVIQRRAQSGVDWLDGGDQRLLQRMRAHGNFSETAPMALLLLALLELSGLQAIWLLYLGGVFMTGRVFHAWSLLTDNAKWNRRGGMVLTLLSISAMALLCVWLFVNPTSPLTA